MGKSTTDQAQTSKDKKILDRISIEDIYQFLQEEDKTHEQRKFRVLLQKQYEDAISDSKTSAFSREDLINRITGKPKESKDITTGGQPLNSVVFDILDNDNNKGE